VDVGYGDAFREPLRLGDPGIQAQAEGRYRLIPWPAAPARYWRVQQERPDRTWKTLFLLDRIPRQLQEFEPMCRFHQTSPASRVDPPAPVQPGHPQRTDHPHRLRQWLRF
jgi:N-hydroxyarylamine O-acetyltransferase